MSNVNELRKEIEDLEQRLQEEKQRLAALRKQMPPEAIDDYEFTANDGSKKRLSEMFGDRDELMLIHNMGKGCAYCTLWADGFNGLHQHLQNRVSFVLVSPDDHQTQVQFAASRGWKFPIYSHKGSTFSKDLGFEQDGKQWPGVSTFRKLDDGSIERVAWAYFGPGDDYCSFWHLLELLPEGVASWQPKFKYD